MLNISLDAIFVHVSPIVIETSYEFFKLLEIASRYWLIDVLYGVIDKFTVSMNRPMVFSSVCMVNAHTHADSHILHSIGRQK